MKPALVLSMFLLVPSAFCRDVHGESGYQVVHGTRVFTVVNRRGTAATFSNACGSQTLTRRAIQAGALPTRIIPCPRTGQPAPGRSRIDAARPAAQGCGNGHLGYAHRRGCHLATPVAHPSPPASRPQADGAAMPDPCLVVQEPKVVSGWAGECTRPDGARGHWNYTVVVSSLARGCPESIEFSYRGPGGKTSPGNFTPFKVQTCDGGPLDIQVRRQQ